MIILGNPGSGKSHFALYALSKALQARKTVLFRSVPYRVVLWFKPGAEVRGGTTLPFLEDKSDDVLFFSDAGTRERADF